MDEKIIVAIDFGSAYTGYTYSFIGRNSNEILFGKFEGTGANIKTLNKIIINNSNEVIKYGFGVEDYLKKGNLKSNEYLFERIKMNLYKNNYEIKAVNSSKTVKLVELIYIIINYLKELAIKSIISSSKGFQDEYKYDEECKRIRWVLTIPAIWNDKNKDIMMKAAEKAGIVKEKGKNLFFALEPEAASYYCAKELPVDDDLFNYPYIICDLGGGTGDIVCHQRILKEGKESIKEKISPRGGAFGSDEINKNFENEVLKSIFGKDIFEKLGQAYIESLRNGKKNFSQKYVVFKNEINHFKESLDVDNYSEETLNIDCSILFNINKGIKIKEAIDNYNNNCRNGWKINVDGMDEDDRAIPFPYKIIYDLTKDITKEISKILIDIIHNVSNTKTIFYVGGFCNSKMVVDSIRENIDKEYPNLNHIRPNDPGNAVLKGAVMYGISPDRIKIRKAKYSLGMSAYLDWKSDYENGGIKYYDDEFKKYVCKNAFYNFISKEEDIPYDNIIKKPLRLRKYDDGIYGGELIIYKSTKINTLFIDEDDVEEIGRFNLLIDDGNEYSDGDEIFYVSMELGGTFLNAKAFHEKSNTCEEIKFKY